MTAVKSREQRAARRSSMQLVMAAAEGLLAC
jgi:hypothetical protein